MAETHDWERAKWERLIEILNGFARASAVGPDRIHVTLADRVGSKRDVDILMSPDQWSDLNGTIWGSFDDAVRQIKESLDDLPAGHPFLIFHLYELVPSRTVQLPEDPDVAKLREHLRKNPGAVGEWRAYRRDGSYARFPEPPPRDA